MKKLFSILIIAASTLSFSSAASVTCLDFSTNLSRGAESSLVLGVQNFLFAKGFLKVTPNGYFGPSTFAAVKAYQGSKGFAQVGNTGPATRAAIKMDSCTSTQTQTTPQATTTPAVSTSISTSSTAQTVSVTAPRPSISSFDVVTLFAGGTTNWGFAVYGTNFSTSSNTITLRNPETRKTYTIGSVTSASGTSLMMPANLTGTTYSCGTGCNELLTSGTYEMTISTTGGQSDVKILNIQPFTLYAQTTAVNTLPAAGANNKLAVLSFSSSQPVIVRSVAFVTGTSTISASGLGSITLKDEMTGAAFINDTQLNSYQSVLISAYASTNNSTSGTISATFNVEIEDYLGKKRTSFTSLPILMTVDGVI